MAPTRRIDEIGSLNLLKKYINCFQNYLFSGIAEINIADCYSRKKI